MQGIGHIAGDIAGHIANEIHSCDVATDTQCC